jgi:hypothetical protein
MSYSIPEHVTAAVFDTIAYLYRRRDREGIWLGLSITTFPSFQTATDSPNFL